MSTQKQPVPASTLGKFITMGQLPAIRDLITKSVMQKLELAPKTASPTSISVEQVEDVAIKVATRILNELVEKMLKELKAEILAEVRSNLTSDDPLAELTAALEGDTAEAVIPVGQPADTVIPEVQPAARPAAAKSDKTKTAKPKGKTASKDAPQPDKAAPTPKTEEVKPATAPTEISAREQLRAMRTTHPEGEK